nr:hypothetical protein [uncultured Prevotella sp.]
MKEERKEKEDFQGRFFKKEKRKRGLSGKMFQERKEKRKKIEKNKSQSFGINSVDWDFYHAEEIIVNFSKFSKDNLRIF